jgi:Flp pilus assembly pilin Flp
VRSYRGKFSITGFSIVRKNMSLTQLAKSVWTFFAAASGVTAIEYALIAAAMGVATAVGMTLVGPAVTSNFQLIANSF